MGKNTSRKVGMVASYGHVTTATNFANNLSKEDKNVNLRTSSRQIESVVVAQSFAEANAMMHQYRDLAYDQPRDAEGNIVSDYYSGVLRLSMRHPNGPKTLGILSAEVVAGRFEYSVNDSDPAKNEYTSVVRPDLGTWNGAPKAVHVRWFLTADSPFPQAEVTFIDVQLWGGQSVVRQSNGTFDGQEAAWKKTQAYYMLRAAAATRLNSGIAFEDLSAEEQKAMTKADGTRRQPMANGLYYVDYIPEHDLPNAWAWIPYVQGQRYERATNPENWHRYGIILSGATESRRRYALAADRRDPLEIVKLQETFADRYYRWQVGRISGLIQTDQTDVAISETVSTSI